MKTTSGIRAASVRSLLGAWIALCSVPLAACGFHVEATGEATADGGSARPLRTTQAAADRGQPGDTSTVREGDSREWIDNRIFNNFFIAPAGLDTYGKSTFPNRMAANLFCNGAKPAQSTTP